MAVKVKDLTGKVFGRWTVVALLPKSTQHRKWLCQCECGKVKNVFHSGLTSGISQSCGCLLSQWAKEYGIDIGVIAMRIRLGWATPDCLKRRIAT